MPTDIQALPGNFFNADHRVYSNYFADNHVIQNVAIVQPKNLVIDTLRKYFSNDNIYTYRYDEFGFPLIVDLTDSDIDAETTTKIVISDSFRYDPKFYPNITIKTSGGTSVPLSINQNSTIKYRKDLSEDEFGYLTPTLTPTHRVYAGAWDMNFDITVSSESSSELEEITEITTMILQYSAWNELRANGLFIKSLSISGQSEEPYGNDHVFSYTIGISCRSEWRVEIPIENIIEKIVFYFDVERHYIPGVSNSANQQALKYDDIIELAEIYL